MSAPLNPTPRLSIIVASFNSASYLGPCLASLESVAPPPEGEVLVVDNRSTDGSPELVEREFPWVTLVRNERNEGFAKANNRALALSRGRFVLLLNPDTVVPPDTLPPMMDFLEENPEVGMAGCRLERADGRLDEACKRSFPTPLSSLSRFLQLDRVFPRSRLAGSYRRTWQDPRGRYEVDSLVGAFMLCRREMLEDVGGLDEDFFMFGQDLDWCYRVKSRRWKVFYLGDRRVIHHKGVSTGREPHRMNYHFHRSMILFHRKHLEGRYPFFINWLVYSGIGLRYALKSLGVALARRPRRPLSPDPLAARLEAAFGSAPAGAPPREAGEDGGPT